MRPAGRPALAPRCATCGGTTVWRSGSRLDGRRPLPTDAGARTASPLDVNRTAQELAEVAAPPLADFACVDLLDSVIRGEEPASATVGGAPLMRRSGQQSVNEGCPEAALAI